MRTFSIQQVSSRDLKTININNIKNNLKYNFFFILFKKKYLERDVALKFYKISDKFQKSKSKCHL